jgi:hypothetical protein
MTDKALPLTNHLKKGKKQITIFLPDVTSNCIEKSLNDEMKLNF